MYRSIMEGIAYEYAYYFEVLKKLYPGADFKRMYAIGGGAASDLFNSVKSDVLGLPVTTYQMGDTALVGSAVIAGFGAGVLDDYKAPILKVTRMGKSFKPDMGSHEAYKKHAREYLNVIDALRGVYQSEIYGIE